MKVQILILLLLISKLFFAQTIDLNAGYVDLGDCDWKLIKLNDSTSKIIVNYDSLLRLGESCFLGWLNMAENKPNGTLLVYDNNGNKRRSVKYLSKSRTGYSYEWYSTGELKAKTEWIDDIHHNQWAFYPSGNIRFEGYNINTDSVISREFYESGVLKSISDARRASDIFYFESGKLEKEINYKKHYYKEYYPNGFLKIKGELCENNYYRRGKWEYYDEKGKLSMRLYYEKNNSNNIYVIEEGWYLKKEYKNGKLLNKTKSNTQ